MSEIARAVGENLRALRQQRGLSQESLALKAGINTSYMGQLERGEKSPTVDTLDKLSTALDVPLAQLFQFDTPRSDIIDTTFTDKIMFQLQDRTVNEQEMIFQFIKQLLLFRDKK
ncbi:helix-turn-helix domain-containing protein [Paenibacillus sp. 481]|uniref:helix-turn-helix domain-containing protein n=1 Tax=Paenibacillus sp. 481 TaxID=2835869 RepID=UPI001E2EB903|nr:helix-turn-helix transcriptional regulator [Paenibacillus sp. 481]UHA72800.1 helix-turn-helix transcriptional regulator [Paenibacillus sp. 481]